MRLNVTSPLGRTLAQRYGVRAVPTMLVLDGRGQVVYFQPGAPDREAIQAAVAGR